MRLFIAGLAAALIWASMALAQPSVAAREQLIERLYQSAAGFHQAAAAQDSAAMLHAAERRLPFDTLLLAERTAQGVFLTGQQMIAMARTVAGDNVQALNRVAAVEEKLPRGSISGGYQLTQYPLEIGGAKHLQMTFLPNRTALIYAEGPMGAELDMIVTGQPGKAADPICEDRRSGPYMLCRWTPENLQEVQVTITNRSAAPSQFFILTN